LSGLKIPLIEQRRFTVKHRTPGVVCAAVREGEKFAGHPNRPEMWFAQSE